MITCSCGRDFSTSPTLFVHQRSTGHCFCRLCNRQFDNEPSLALHDKAVHHRSSSDSQEPKTSLPNLPKAKKKTKTWACPQCVKSFISQRRLEDHCSVAHLHKCGDCTKAYITLKPLQIHNRLTGHCFCRQCDRSFPNASDLAEHKRTFIHVAGFHCCDCDRDFVHQQALDQHLQFKDHSYIEKRHECNECQREFFNRAALDKHRASLAHNPLSDLGCVASSKCKQRFSSPSALIQHLESGKCRSGLTRKGLNQLVQRNDTDRLISSGLEEQDMLGELQARLSSLTLTSHPIRTPASSEDSTPIMTPVTDDGFGVMLSPYLGMRSPTLSPADVSAIQTRSGPRNNGLFCPLCPERPNPFRTLAGLEMHLASAKHAPKAFHCPSSIFPPTKGKGSHRGSIRHFSSLSGLTQHIESGACRGGKATLQKAIELLEERLKDTGLGQIRLLK